MCEFVSWLETSKGPLFLTDADLSDKSLRDIPKEDLIGHGAIKKFYGLLHSKNVKERETPSDLPIEIVKALKDGKMIEMMRMANINTFCINDNGQRHRTDGPAVERANGDKAWWKNGKRHRTGGPAVERVNGDKEWYKNGQCHRTGGPAIEWANGYKAWWKNGQLHRTDGPAIEWARG